MNLFHSILLGFVQGATEFLPVSSSGHLILVERLLNNSACNQAFDVSLHMGTLVGLVFYFRNDFIQMGKFCLPAAGLESEARSFYRRLVLFIVLATAPAVGFALLLGSAVETTLRGPVPVAISLAVGGFFLLAAERFGRRIRSLEQVNISDAIVIGLAQAVALIPGVSRSGITITAGLFLGLERKAAARFSFLLSAPVILGAGVYHLPGLFQAEWVPGQVGFYLSGFIAAALSGYLCIAFLIRFVQARSLAVFAYYRFVLAGVVLLFFYL